MADFRTTPVSLQTFMSITDSNGIFKTWADIKKNTLDALPVNEDILGTKIKAPQEIQGNNIIFENVENKNIFPFVDDLTKFNNKPTMDKMIMNLYSDYMLTLEFNLMDKHSCIEWSQILSDAMSSMMIAKKDFENMLVIDELQKVCIALGRVSLIKNTNKLSTDFDKNKKLGMLLANDRIMNRTKRSKFMKGYNAALERFLVSPQLSLNLLSGLTAGSAAAPAYKDTKERFKVQEVFGHSYETTSMYLGQSIGMSEFTPDGGSIQNTGKNTGQCIKPFNFDKLQGLLFYNESIAYYSQNFDERVIPSPTKRYTDVLTIAFRTNAAVKPIYSSINKAYFSEIPKFDSYTDINNNVVPAIDCSKEADMRKLINNLYQSQPQLYSMFGWNGNSQITQAEITKMWSDNTIDWEN